MAITNEYTLTISVKDAQTNVNELNKSLAAQKDLIQDLQDEIADYEKKLKGMDPRDKNRIKNTEELIEVTKKQLKDEKDGLKQVNTERKEANTTLKEATKKQADFGGIIGYVDKQTGGAISGMKKFYGSIVKATTGMKFLRIAIIGTGIGALVVLITSLVAAFSQSEKGQEKMQQVMAVLGAVVKQVMDYFADLGEKIISVFTDPKQALIDLKDAIVKNITNRVTSLIETFGYLGTAIKKVFQGDFSGAMDSAKSAGSSFTDTMTGVKGSIDKATNAIREFGRETNKEIDATLKITKSRQKAHHIERALQVERAKANREINDIRLKAEDRVNNTATERIALLRKAQKIEEKITEKEIYAKNLMVKAQIAEMALGKNNIESKDKLAALQAELINLDTKKLRSQRLLQTQITTAINEEAAAKKKVQDEAEAELAAQEKVVADRIAKELKTEEDRLKALNEVRKDFYTALRLEQAKSLREGVWLRMQMDMAETKWTEENATLKDAKQKYWNEKLAVAEKKDSDNKKALDKSVLDAKLDSVSQAFGLVAGMAEKGSKLEKAMAIGQATISGYQGVQNAFTTASGSPIAKLWPAYPFVTAGLAGAFAIANIRKIASTNPKGNGPPPPPPAAPSVSTPSIPADFNTVGASGTNQLADAIGGQVQRPTRAYVVSTDVTTAQSLDRNIITGATVG
tara:strand:+ start:495 stop:2555 length:2061 start_codon:yes stop_codon:yes gene_type:complete